MHIDLNNGLLEAWMNRKMGEKKTHDDDDDVYLYSTLLQMLLSVLALFLLRILRLLGAELSFSCPAAKCYCDRAD